MTEGEFPPPDGTWPSDAPPSDARALSETWVRRGNARAAAGDMNEALASYERALALWPGNADARNNRGNVLRALGRRSDALASYDAALQSRSDYAEAWSNRGDVLFEMKRPADALDSYGRALSLKETFPEAHYGRGLALAELDRAAEALTHYDRALVLRPDYAEALNNRGNALRELRRPKQALASYDAALRLKPDFAEAHYNRGLALLSLKRHAEAAASFAQALRLSPNRDYTLGYLFHTRLHGCDWTDFEAATAKISAAIARGEKRDMPFSFMVHSSDPALQLQCARSYANDKYPAAAEPVWRGQRYRHDKIRIAYLSADFRDHATAYLAAELFELHDRARFEIEALSFGPGAAGAMHERLRRAFDGFTDTDAMTNRDIAQWLRAHEIDIAVDLKGFTQGGRPGIFAQRGAPVQAAYLGYPGTMGASYYDYLLADPRIVPRSHEMFYSEKIVRLPDSYQVNDRKRRIAAPAPSRAELGLPETGFVFCCLNNNYKIMPGLFDIWMRVLQRVAGSVLWILEDNATASRNLKREAERRGVSAERLVFAPRLEQSAHLARQTRADLFLDTFPCNAHTTASDALWAGLPLVTCMGETFASRVAGSLLYAAGVPELIARNLSEYETLAVELAAAPGRLNAIKARLAGNRDACRLFDTPRFCRHIEAAYSAMHDRQQRGEAPASFDVTPVG